MARSKARLDSVRAGGARLYACTRGVPASQDAANDRQRTELAATGVHSLQLVSIPAFRNSAGHGIQEVIMNKTSQTDSHKTSSSSPGQPGKTSGVAAPSSGAAHKAEPGKASQQTVRPTTPTPTSKDHPAPPVRAAKGDDDLMSKQQQQAMPSSDAIKGKWQQQLGAAKIAWGKLTDDELLKSEGHEQKLAGLIQERYATTREEAEKRVKSFFAKH